MFFDETGQHSAQADAREQATPVLRKTARPKPKALERAEKRLQEERQSWKVDIGAATSTAEKKGEEDAPNWAKLLQSPDKPTAGFWTPLDKRLTAYCLSAPGPINPRTGQYLVEIRLERGNAEQVMRAREGIEALLPFIKPVRGEYEFRIKAMNIRYKEKNWLSISKSGKVSVQSNVHPAAAFEDLQSALAFISEHRPATESLQ